MIVPMRKYSFLVYHKNYLEFLESIRSIGVLHVIEKQEGVAENQTLNEQLQLVSRIKAAQRMLSAYVTEGVAAEAAAPEKEGAVVLAETESRLSQLESLQQKLQVTDREWERMEVWGTFSHELIQNLAGEGQVLHFFSCNTRKFDPEWEVNYPLFEIDTVGTTRYFVVISSPGMQPEIDADPVKLSDRNAVEIAAEKEAIRAQISASRKELEGFATGAVAQLEQYQRQVNGEIDFSRVMLNTRPEADNKVMLLEGWSPVEKSTELETYLNTAGVYYEAADPDDTEPVPVKLKNSKFAALFENIGDLYDLPNYREIDLTPFFAPFFLLFFGLCLGDSAYGLLIVLASLYARRKAKESMKPMFTLAAWLGGSTVLIGMITGSFFGFEIAKFDIPFIEQFKKYILSPDDLFNVALILGVIQIIFGMIIKTIGTIRRFGFAAGISLVGWLLVILGGGTTYLVSMLVDLSPQLLKVLYYIFFGLGGVMVFLLNDLKRNPLINVGAGVWDFYNMATGLLGDLLSYIRLFALGISSSVMGIVFNDLAINLSGDVPVVSTIVMLIIMIFGHGINIFMGALGSFVHPMRLTFVEFYKNAGFEGGGKKYRPFKSVEK